MLPTYLLTGHNHPRGSPPSSPLLPGGSSSGLEVHRKESNFPPSPPLSSFCSTGKCTFLTASCSPSLERRFWVPPLLPYPPQRITPSSARGIRKFWWGFFGLKYRHFAPNEQHVSKCEQQEGGREGFFRAKSTWMVLMELCEILLFMKQPALPLPEISFYWHVQSDTIPWLPSLL